MPKHDEVPDAPKKPKTVPKVVGGKNHRKQRQQPPPVLARRHHGRSQVTNRVKSDKADPSPDGGKPPEGSDRKEEQG